MKTLPSYFSSALAWVFLTCLASTGGLRAGDDIRVTWVYAKTAATPAAAWTLFLSNLESNPRLIFDAVSSQTEPTELPLSFPGASSPWDSTVELISLTPTETTLTAVYNITVNDVVLTNLKGADRALWLCNLVEDWIPSVQAYARTRWGNPSDFLVTVEQTDCQSFDEVFEEVAKSFRFATSKGDLWYNSPWFGDFSAAFYPWIYRETVGWVYLLPQEAPHTGITFWHPDDNTWYWSGEDVYPEAYDLQLERWVIFR